MRNRTYAATIYLLPCRRFCAKNDIGPRLLFGLEDPDVYNRWPPWSTSQPAAVTMDAGLLRRSAMLQAKMAPTGDALAHDHHSWRGETLVSGGDHASASIEAELFAAPR